MRYVSSRGSTGFLTRVILGLALAFSTVTVADLATSSPVWAGNGNGGGPGGGHGGGHGGGQGNGFGRGGDEDGGRGRGRGSVSSELGKANAAHASDRARERAASHSAVGIMGAYRDAVEEEMDLGASLSEAHDAVAEDFSDAIDGIADFSDDAVDALGGMLGLDTD